MNPPLQARGAGSRASTRRKSRSNGSKLQHLLRLCAAVGALTLVTACARKPVPAPQGPLQVGYVTLRAEPVTRTTELPGRTAPTL